MGLVKVGKEKDIAKVKNGKKVECKEKEKRKRSRNTERVEKDQGYTERRKKKVEGTTHKAELLHFLHSLTS